MISDDVLLKQFSDLKDSLADHRVESAKLHGELKTELEEVKSSVAAIDKKISNPLNFLTQPKIAGPLLLLLFTGGGGLVMRGSSSGAATPAMSEEVQAQITCDVSCQLFDVADGGTWDVKTKKCECVTIEH